jgi:hypothetical protein
MTNSTRHTRILEFPHTRSLVNARLDDLREETLGSQRDLICDFRELRLLAPPELIASNTQPYERLRGEYVPRRLCFRGLRWIKSGGVFVQLSDVPPASEQRQLEGLLCSCGWKIFQPRKPWHTCASIIRGRGPTRIIG